jgi:UDP-glucose 4-epimerase
MTDRNVSVLVTGGAGYLGSHVVLCLADAGYRVVVVDNLSTGIREAVDPRALFFEGNVCNTSLVRSLLQMHKVRIILHLAGSADVTESIADPLKYYGNNSAASRSLIESAVACSVPHFVFSSTAATYGVSTNLIISETARQRPINPFGVSMLVTERILADTAAAHHMNYCTLRSFNVAGADPQGRAGQNGTNGNRLIKTAIEAVFGKHMTVSVFGTDYETPDGTCVRDYMHVTDFASAHLAAIKALTVDPTRNLVLNCGNGVGYSVLDVLRSVERVTNVSLSFRLAPRRTGDPATVVADNRAILASLDWKPQFPDIETMIRDEYKWERALPNAHKVIPDSQCVMQSECR